MNGLDFPGGVTEVDFEFHFSGKDGNLPVPVCMVIRNHETGECQRYWRDALLSMKGAPFPIADDSVTVVYMAIAEMGCFEVLGWKKPVHLLDLFVEFRCHTNGISLPAGSGLIGALVYFGLIPPSAAQKCAMRDLILGGGPWTKDQKEQILNYCESDVIALGQLLDRMVQ